MQRLTVQMLLLCLSFAFASDKPLATPVVPKYRLTQQYILGGDGGWDYIALDSLTRRLYVSHSTSVDVLDADTGRLVGRLSDTPGVHGTALASELHKGFASNGGDGSVTVFDTISLKILGRVKVNRPDFILYDSFSKRVFPMNEKISVLDAVSAEPVGEVDLGGEPEAGASDNHGSIFVNVANRNSVAVVDVTTLKVKAIYPIADCTSPHSLSYDETEHRLFIGCRNGRLAILDATTGQQVGETLICSGVDGSAWDPETKILFESCGEGVISVIHQFSADYYDLVDTVKTELWAKTMAFDPKTKRVYLPTASFEFRQSSIPGQRIFERQTKSRSFRILVVAPPQK